MATVVETVNQSGPCRCEMTFDSVTRVVTRIQWYVPSGIYTVLIRQAGKADIVRSVGQDGILDVPAASGYLRDTAAPGSAAAFSWRR